MTVDAMAKPTDSYSDPDMRVETEVVMEDTVDTIVPVIPILLPATGAVLIFMLAFIAVYMA